MAAERSPQHPPISAALFQRYAAIRTCHSWALHSPTTCRNGPRHPRLRSSIPPPLGQKKAIACATALCSTPYAPLHATHCVALGSASRLRSCRFVALSPVAPPRSIPPLRVFCPPCGGVPALRRRFGVRPACGGRLVAVRGRLAGVSLLAASLVSSLPPSGVLRAVTCSLVSSERVSTFYSDRSF